MPKEKGARRCEENEALDCVANVVAEAVDHTVKALCTVNDAMHEHEPEMVLKMATHSMQYEARMEEIDRIEKPETFEEVYQTPDMKVISGKWVDAEKVAEVAMARRVLRGFEEKTTKEDC